MVKVEWDLWYFETIQIQSLWFLILFAFCSIPSHLPCPHLFCQQFFQWFKCVILSSGCGLRLVCGGEIQPSHWHGGSTVCHLSCVSEVPWVCVALALLPLREMTLENSAPGSRAWEVIPCLGGGPTSGARYPLRCPLTLPGSLFGPTSPVYLFSS